MSLCFVMNLSDCVLIAGDGRSTRRPDYQIVSDDREKVTPIAKNAVFYVSGRQYVSEKIRNEVNSSIVQRNLRSFDEIDQVITKSSMKNVEEFKVDFPELIDENDTLAGGVLAMYDSGPILSSYNEKEKFVPLISRNVLDRGFVGMGMNEAMDYFEHHFYKRGQALNLFDLVYDTYQYVTSSVDYRVGGLLKMYKVNENGVSLVVDRRIEPCSPQTKLI